MGQENVYFGTEPLLTRMHIPAGRRVPPMKTTASRKASIKHTRTPWMATMTKGDHMAAYEHTGTPEGVRGQAGGKQ
jgi:hypothetical protein